MTAGSEGVFRNAVTKVYHNGKQFLETLLERGVPIRAGPKVRGFGGERPHVEVRTGKPQTWTANKSLFSSFQQTYSQSRVASIGREAAKKMWNPATVNGTTLTTVNILWKGISWK